MVARVACYIKKEIMEIIFRKEMRLVVRNCLNHLLIIGLLDSSIMSTIFYSF